VAGGGVPLRDIAVETARTWLKTNLHELDSEHHVEVHPRIHPGSLDLQALFSGGERSGIAPANDTSVGVGHANRKCP
jgi:S-adenosylmethionine synthetase